MGQGLIIDNPSAVGVRHLKIQNQSDIAIGFAGFGIEDREGRFSLATNIKGLHPVLSVPAGGELKRDFYCYLPWSKAGLFVFDLSTYMETGFSRAAIRDFQIVDYSDVGLGDTVEYTFSLSSPTLTYVGN